MSSIRPRLAAALLALLGSVVTSACAENPADATLTAGQEVSAAPDFTTFEQVVFGGGAVTEGVVVQHRGVVVYERYAAGYDASKRHLAYSVSKSIGSALLGIAIRDGLLGLDDSVCQHVPPPPGAAPTLCDTTIRNLVHMASGLDFGESYVDPTTSNVLPMMYGDEDDAGLYVAGLPRRTAAGTKVMYSSGDSNLLARAIRGALHGRDMREWANEKLFVPAGLSSAIFESDRSGTLLFGSGAFLTPRDLARFGQMYLDGGRVGSTQVLPARWVEFSKTPAPPVSTPTPHISDQLGERGGSYGAQFWLNAATPTAPVDTLLYAEAPHEMFCAQGNWGQRVCMVPSRDLVVVRVGNDRAGFYDVGPAMAAAVAAIDGTKGAK